MGILAGFGSCEVAMTVDMLPVSRERYTGIHDLPSVKIMLLRGEEPFALVNVGLVMGDREAFLNEAEKSLDIPRSHIVVHFQHILSTAHYEVAESPLLHEAYCAALRSAARQALEKLQPARFGVCVTTAPVTVNRVIETAEGWWQGVNPDGLVDSSVSVLSVDREDGIPMGLVYTVNAAPGCLEFSSLPDGRRISADLAGASERFLEEQLGENLVAMYCTGATGDQWTALRARMDYLTADGRQVVKDLGEAGFSLVEILATRLGERVIRKAMQTATASIERFLFRDAVYRYPHQDVLDASPAHPARTCRYVVSGEDEAGVKLLTLGDSAVVFCGSEMNASALAALRESSPFANTWLIEFSAQGGDYMPPSDFYDRVTYQSLKCHYAKGSAERFVQDVQALLEEADHG